MHHTTKRLARQSFEHPNRVITSQCSKTFAHLRPCTFKNHAFGGTWHSVAHAGFGLNGYSGLLA